MSNEGAVEDAMLVRWSCDEAEDRKGSLLSIQPWH